MDQAERQRTQLECLYDMFRDRIEENVVYIVYTENDGCIEQAIDQLMSISNCSLTGHYFEPSKALPQIIQDETSAMHERDTESVNPIKTSAQSDDFKLVRKSRRVNANHKRRNQQKIQEKRLRSDAASSATTGESNEEEVLDDEDLENEDEEEPELDVSIEDLQSSIDNLLTEKGICHDKASHYLNKKMFPVTSYYSELASQYNRSIENKTKKLVELLLMKSENCDCIDLHGLNPIQAKLVVSQLLKSRQDKLSIDKQGEASVDIITGWGKHTVAEGNHRIRPTIISFLRERGHEFHHINKGALRVVIRR